MFYHGRQSSSGDAKTLTKTKMVLAATLLLGTASVSLASPDDSDVGGYPVQTWQDIQHDQRALRLSQSVHTRSVTRIQLAF
jgi:hypothetical protein